MSYYCKGEVCHRANECARHLIWRDFVDTFEKPDAKEGFETGIWYVQERTCINNDYKDGVFKTD